MEIVQCESCGMRVFPKADNSCPSCGHSFGPPLVEKDESVEDVEHDRANEELLPNASSPNQPTQTPDGQTISNGNRDESTLIVTEALPYSRESLRKSLQTLQWAALLSWGTVPIGSGLGYLVSIGLISGLGTSMQRTIAKTQSLTPEKRLQLRSKTTTWMIVGLLPAIIWTSGYLFWEDGFNFLSLWK